MDSTLLIVDDFKNIRDLLTNTLERKGFNIITAEHGKAAIELLKTQPKEIDLVLSDYNMPEMNGQQLLEAIKSDQSISDIPVAFLTTEKDPSKIRDAKKAGLDAWISKPYKLDAFINQINHLLK